MSLGLCCQYMSVKQKKNNKEEYINLCDEKSLQFSRFKNNEYSIDKINKTWEHNINSLFNIVKLVNEKGYSLMRMSSRLFPLAEELPNELKNNVNVLKSLKDMGDFIKSKNMRFTCHPDQFVVLSSNSDDVIEKSVKIFTHHAWVFDSIGLDNTPFYAINIHGGVRGNQDKLIRTLNLLPASVKGRLTLENDESSYSVKELFSVFESTKIPIVFDSHHYSFNTGDLTDVEAFELAKSTWGSIKPLTHLSNTDPLFLNGSFKDKRKHSDYVHYIPSYQMQENNDNKIDIEMEFKMKNLAIEKAVKDFTIKL